MLAIGETLRDPRVENTSFGSTRTFLEHEIVLWNPSKILEFYGTGQPFEGSTCLTEASSAKYNRDAQRRWQELHDFLELGRLLVVLLPTPRQFFTATGEEENEGTAAKPRIKQLVVPRQVDDLIPVEFDLVPASGRRFKVLAGDAFAPFWRAVGDQFHDTAYLREAVGKPLLSIKGADRVVSALVEAHGGFVLLLPQRYEYDPGIDQNEGESNEAFDERWKRERAALDKRVSSVFVDALLEFARELRGSSDEGLPDWTERFILPGEAEAVEAASKADDRAARALQRAEKARSNLKRLQRRKVLIADTGRQLELAVEQALVGLGCTVESGEAGRVDRVIRWKRHVAVMEVKGLGKSAREKDAAQLEKWVSEYTIEHGRVPKGVLLVNAWRTEPLDERDKPPFPDQMIPYVEGRKLCLATTSQLLTALASASSVRKKEDFLRALFTTVGVLDGWEWSDALAVAQPVTVGRSP